jgi:Proto-chlorophyllide reductase 57 kD subunit
VSDTPTWTPEAEALLKEIPFFVRPAARKKIENFARENDESEITPEVYARAKAKFN